MANRWSASPIWSSLFLCTPSMDDGMFGISTVGSTMDRRGLCSSDKLYPLVLEGKKMKNILLSFLALATTLLLIPDSARAHHGWAAFTSEPGSQITLKGTVKEFHFVNPHSVVEFKVKDDGGQIQVWEGELTSNTNLTARGWTAASLEEKEEITITGYPAKNGARAMRITKIVLSNGKELKVGGGN